MFSGEAERLSGERGAATVAPSPGSAACRSPPGASVPSESLLVSGLLGKGRGVGADGLADAAVSRAAQRVRAERGWERRWFNGDYPSWKRVCAVNKTSGLAGAYRPSLRGGTMSPQPDALIRAPSDQSGAGLRPREAAQGGREVA